MIKNKHAIVHRAYVYHNNELAGYLLRNRSRYCFLYDTNYAESRNPSIALDMPKKKRIFSSPFLFPFFQGLLPEGDNQAFLCDKLGIQRKDKFTMLLKLANFETIGPVTVREDK